jgi:hypothetical protein
MEVLRSGHTAKDHAVNIHQQNTAKVVQIKAEGSPKLLNMPRNRIVAEKENQCQQWIGAKICKNEGDQPPDLTSENHLPIKTQKGIEDVIVIKKADQIYKARSDENIEHQIGNAPAAMLEAETLKLIAKFIHVCQLLNVSSVIVARFYVKVH